MKNTLQALIEEIVYEAIAGRDVPVGILEVLQEFMQEHNIPGRPSVFYTPEELRITIPNWNKDISVLQNEFQDSLIDSIRSAMDIEPYVIDDFGTFFVDGGNAVIKYLLREYDPAEDAAF
jgi:hypothetical protein